MISVKITKKELVDLNACPEGLAFFMKHAKRGTLKVKWTVDEQLKWLKLEARLTTWAMNRGAIPMLSMQGANLRSADLQYADLQGANLRSADLQGANLQGANLRSADLQGANLRSADLQYANLQGANLRYADLRSANLQSADLQGAYLYGAYGNQEIPGWALQNGVYVRA